MENACALGVCAIRQDSRLQEARIAAPSPKRLHGDLAIRENLTNHRTRLTDLELLLVEFRRIGAELSAKPH